MPLAPSERVLVHARTFAGSPTITSGKETLLLEPDTRVARHPLAESMLAAVVLGAEQAGALRLEARQKKALFGLRTVTDLFAVRTGGTTGFAEGSLERALDAHLTAGERDVGDLLHDVMEEDTQNPAAHALALVRRGLAGRGLLETEERKTLGIFKTAHYVATDALRVEAAAADGGEVRALLDACERERPEIWTLLQKEVRSAFARRQEHDSSDGPDFD